MTSYKKALISLRSSWVMTCSYSPDNEMVACGGLDNLCSVYRSNAGLEDMPIMELAEHEGYLSCCRFVDSERILTSSGDSTCVLWDVNAKRMSRQFVDHSGDVMAVSINPTNSNIFVSGSCDTTARIYDIRSDKAVGTFRGHSADINSVEWFQDGCAFGTGSDDSSIILFDWRAYTQMNVYKDNDAICGI